LKLCIADAENPPRKVLEEYLEKYFRGRRYCNLYLLSTSIDEGFIKELILRSNIMYGEIRFVLNSRSLVRRKKKGERKRSRSSAMIALSDLKDKVGSRRVKVKKHPGAFSTLILGLIRRRPKFAIITSYPLLLKYWSRPILSVYLIHTEDESELEMLLDLFNRVYISAEPARTK